MNPDLRFQPPPDWTDPRLAPDFDAAYFPRCEGAKPPAIGTTDLRERRQLEFLAAYYAINRAAADYATATATERRAALLALHAAHTARDLLEDRYAPIGFFGEPQIAQDRTHDVTFMHAPEAPTPTVLSAAFELTPPMPIPASASSRVLDTAGFLRFLEQQIVDGKADS